MPLALPRTALAIAKLDAHDTYLDAVETQEEADAFWDTDARIRREIAAAFTIDTADINRHDLLAGIGSPAGVAWLRSLLA